MNQMTQKDFELELNKRNEATKVWIQADTQTRAYAIKLEKDLEYWKTMFILLKEGRYIEGKK